MAMPRRYRTGIETVNRNYRMAVDVLQIIKKYAEELQAVTPASLEISDREIIEMLIYGTRRLLDEGEITLEGLFFEKHQRDRVSLPPSGPVGS